MKQHPRREFLQKIAGLSAAGSYLSRLSPLTSLGLEVAQAQPASNYRALVSVFLYGGNDSNNMIVPLDSRFGAYASMRGRAALSQSSLLPVGATGYGFHPRLVGLQRLYNQGRAAMVFNVGMLFRPTTRATLDSVRLPQNLYAHNDQQKQWQTSDPAGGTSGWGGRLNERILPLNPGIVPPGVTLFDGNEPFLSAPQTAPAGFSESMSLALYGGGGSLQARRKGLERILKFDTGVQMVAAANGVLEDSLRTSREFSAALASVRPPAVAFPPGDLGRQLSQVIRLMSVRGALGMNRQIFFTGLVGFDNHANLLPQHDSLMQNIDGAISAFFANLDVMGLTNNVTLFTQSEFNRTATMNSQSGTDHAWGGHQLVFGGAVKPGTYGTFPTLALNGPDDASDRGYWIPTTSLDQFAATLGSWYGVPDADLTTIFPNLANFGPPTLGFL